MKLYPNPVVNILTIQMEAAELPYAEIIIANQNGKIVLRKKFEPPVLQNLKLDMHKLGLERGIYLISAINKNSIVSKRVILME